MKWFFIAALFAFTMSCSKSVPPPAQPDPEKEIPVLEAVATAKASPYTIELSAKIASVGSSAVTEAGFVLDTNQLPSVDKFVKKIASTADASGNISATVTGLQAGRKYFVRGYASNTQGIAYSEEISFSTLDEKVFEGDAIFMTQDELLAFAANHYNRIKGELVITGTVTDLTPLADLVAVSRRINISFNSQLLSLDGLQNIKSVNSEKEQYGLLIAHNDVLPNLEGLEGVTSTYGEVNITKNYALNSLKGLDSLRSLEAGRLMIDDCDKLTTLDGLEALHTVSYLAIWGNELLSDVSGLASLTAVNTLAIGLNPALTNLNGIGPVSSLEILSVFHNEALSDISGLTNLHTIHELQLEGLDITSLAGLEKVNSGGNFAITSCAKLADISALSALTSVQNITLGGTAVTNLNGLQGLLTAWGIYLRTNPELQSLEGLNNIESLQSLTITENPKLTSLQGLTSLSNVFNQGYITDNILLADFCALEDALVNGPDVFFAIANNAANPTRDEVIASCP